MVVPSPVDLLDVIPRVPSFLGGTLAFNNITKIIQRKDTSQDVGLQNTHFHGFPREERHLANASIKY